MAIALQTVDDFRRRLNDVLRQAGHDIANERYPEGYQEAPLAYDAIWAVALGEAHACLSFLVVSALQCYFYLLLHRAFSLGMKFQVFCRLLFPHK
jgi:hypothetical protein